MNLLAVQANLNLSLGPIELAYKLLEAEPTSSDVETTIKQNLLIRIKNLLVESVIIVDVLDELETNKDDETVLETVLDILSDSEDILV